MAGTYPDAPSRRMAYDGDGTVALYRISVDSGATFGIQNAFSSADLAELNDEDNVDSDQPNFSGLGNNCRAWATFIFPELREFDGFFGRLNQGAGDRHIHDIQTSADTTNGIGGTWNSQTTNYAADDASIDVYNNYRTVTSYAAGGIRAVRFFLNASGNQGTRPRAFHIYGDITPGETPDRILWIDELTGVEFTTPADFGDVPRGSSEDIEVRLKNNSASLTATTVQYTAEDLYLGSGAWYTATLPGGSTFQGTRQIASIGPATTTAVITVRRVTSGAATLGLHAARYFVNTGSWA